MRILVTGAAGLTGGAVAHRLAELGHDVTGVVRRVGQSSAGGTTVVADVTSTDMMRCLLTATDACVHVAGIQLGERLGAVRAGAHRLVAVSSAGIYSRHRASAATYGRHELALQTAFENCLIVRPTMIYGSRRDRNVHQVLAFARRYRFLPLVGRGDSLVQPIHYLDLAEALVALVLGDAIGIVDAGGGAPLTVREAAIAVFHALHLPPRLLPIPLAPAVKAAHLIDAIRQSRVSERLERLAEDRSVDNSRLVALSGLVPRELPVGLRDMVAASS